MEYMKMMGIPVFLKDECVSFLFVYMYLGKSHSSPCYLRKFVPWLSPGNLSEHVPHTVHQNL